MLISASRNYGMTIGNNYSNWILLNPKEKTYIDPELE